MSDLHALLTVVFFVIFVGIVALTYSKGQKSKLDEAAQIPLRDDVPVSEQKATTPPNTSSESNKS